MRKGTDDEAIVIRDKPGKIIGGLLSVMTALAMAGVLGGIAFAYAQSNTNGEVRANIEAANKSIGDQENRLNRMDTKMDGVQKTVTDMQIQQGKMDTKIDLLLRSQGINPPSPAR